MLGQLILGIFAVADVRAVTSYNDRKGSYE